MDINKEIITDIPIITHDYKDLLYYDEPIIFCGKNKNNDMVLGYCVGDNDKEKFEESFNVVVSQDTFCSFLNRSLSFFDVLMLSHPIYSVRDYYVENKKRIFKKELSDMSAIHKKIFDESFFPTSVLKRVQEAQNEH